MQHKKAVACASAVLLAIAVACSKNPGTPVSPSSAEPGVRVIQELLGHASISTTEVYTHVMGNRLREVHKKFHPRP